MRQGLSRTQKLVESRGNIGCSNLSATSTAEIDIRLSPLHGARSFRKVQLGMSGNKSFGRVLWLWYIEVSTVRLYYLTAHHRRALSVSLIETWNVRRIIDELVVPVAPIIFRYTYIAKAWVTSRSLFSPFHISRNGKFSVGPWGIEFKIWHSWVNLGENITYSYNDRIYWYLAAAMIAKWIYIGSEK